MTTPPERDDATTPSGDFFDQLADAAERLGPELMRQIEDAVSNNGRKLVRMRCKACGEMNEKYEELIDVEEKRKTYEMLSSIQLRRAAQRKDDDSTSKRARDLLRDRSEMTDEQLAEVIAALEVDLEERS